MNKISKYYDSIFSYISNINNSMDNFYKEIDLSRLSEISLLNKENLLDLGCGLAPYSRVLGSDFESIYLVDASKKFLTKAENIVKNSNSQKNIYAINCEYKDLHKFEIPGIDLIIASGASLCYHENSLIKGLELSHKLLKCGGYIFGDVWNKYGILISDLYRKEIPPLILEPSIKSVNIIKDFIIKGITTEIVENNYIDVYMTDSYLLKKELLDIGFNNINLFGRKTLSLLWNVDVLNDMIVNNYKYSFELEKLLSSYELYMAVSPKISFIAKK